VPRSVFELVVLQRRRAGVHDDGVELQRAPLPELRERAIFGPQRGVGVPTAELGFEQFRVIANEPAFELVLVRDLDQLHGVLLVDFRQGEGVRGGRGIDGVDPVDERLAVPTDQGRAIEHVYSCAGRRAVDHAARAWYSWISPPRTSRRRTAAGDGTCAALGPVIGVARPTPRCGRWVL